MNPTANETTHHRRTPHSRPNTRFRNNHHGVRIATAAAVASRRQAIRNALHRKVHAKDAVVQQQIAVPPTIDLGSAEAADINFNTDSNTGESATPVDLNNSSNDDDHNTDGVSLSADPLPLEDTSTNNNFNATVVQSDNHISEPVARTRTDEALERLITGLEGFLSLSDRLNRLEAAQKNDRQIEQPPPYQVPQRSARDELVESGPSIDGYHFPILDMRFPWVDPESNLDVAQAGDSKPLDLIDLVHPAFQDLVNETQNGNIRPWQASGSASRYIAEKEEFINFFCHPSIFVAAWSAWGECMVRGSFSPVWRMDMLEAVNWHLSYILDKSQKYQWAAVMGYHYVIHLERRRQAGGTFVPALWFKPGSNDHEFEFFNFRTLL